MHYTTTKANLIVSESQAPCGILFLKPIGCDDLYKEATLDKAVGVRMSTQIQSWFQKTDDDITLTLYVQPGAKCDEIIGLHGNALKIKLATPPIEGRANKALLLYIAKLFRVPLSQVSLKRGKKSRYKIVEIQASCVSPESILYVSQ